MNTIITIGRQFGSGGREIGEKLAKHDERPTNSFLYNLVMDTYSFGYNSSAFVDMPISHKVFLAQFDTIKKIASEGPCVIVGRCADYALSEYQNCLHVFIHADEKSKIKHIMEKHGDVTSEQKARDMMIKKDKQRQSYYNYYSSKKWGRADSYDLTINSGILGEDGTVKLLIQYIEDFEARGQK